jgi:hypothetical protein
MDAVDESAVYDHDLITCSIQYHPNSDYYINDSWIHGFHMYVLYMKKSTMFTGTCTTDVKHVKSERSASIDYQGF